MAQAVVDGLDHLAVIVADAEVFMQCQRDSDRGVEVPDFADQLDAEMNVVMKVDDVGLDDIECFAKVSPDASLVGLGKVEPVSHDRLEQDLARSAGAGEWRTTVDQPLLVVPTEKHGIEFLALL